MKLQSMGDNPSRKNNNLNISDWPSSEITWGIKCLCMRKVFSVSIFGSPSFLSANVPWNHNVARSGAHTDSPLQGTLIGRSLYKNISLCAASSAPLSSRLRSEYYIRNSVPPASVFFARPQRGRMHLGINMEGPRPSPHHHSPQPSLCNLPWEAWSDICGASSWHLSG